MQFPGTVYGRAGAAFALLAAPWLLEACSDLAAAPLDGAPADAPTADASGDAGADTGSVRLPDAGAAIPPDAGALDARVVPRDTGTAPRPPSDAGTVRPHDAGNVGMPDAGPQPSPLCSLDRPLRCGDECVNPLTDRHHCGRCGARCSGGDRCVVGRCVEDD